MALLVTRRKVAHAAVLLALSAMTCTAHADAGDPLQLRLDYQVTHDSNFFRLPKELPPSSEVIQILSAGLIVDKALSRQNIRMELSKTAYRYQQHPTLDFNGFNFQGDWHWQLGNDWSGVASYGQSDTAGTYENIQTQDLNPYKIRQRTRSINANYRLGAVTSLWGTVSDYQRDSSLSVTDQINNRSDEFGVRFDSSGGNYLGVSYRFSAIDYPNQQAVGGVLVDNGYKDNEVKANARWIYSGKTSVDGGLSAYRRKHNQFAERDVSGLQGRLAANWAATGHLLLTGELWRSLSPIDQLTANYTLNRGAGISAIWTVSSKVTVRGRVSREEREYLGDPGYVLNLGPRRVDTLFTPELSLDYQFWRNAGMTLSYQAPERSSNYPFSGYAYNALMFSAFAQF